MMMIPIHVIAFFLAIMLVPEDVHQFTIAVQGEQIQWTQHKTGWYAVELPRDDWGSYKVEGTEVTVAGEGREMKTKISRYLEIPEHLDWKKATEIPVAMKSLGDPVQIQREDGKIVFSQAKGALFKNPVTVTWKPAKKVANTVTHAPDAVTALPLAPDETVYEVKDGEATVNGVLIKRFSVGGKKVTASYQNKSVNTMRPCYSIELYNARGILLGEDTTSYTPGLFLGGPGCIDPGEVGSEERCVTWYPVDRILSKSAMPLPTDWKTVKWILLKDNDPRIIKVK